MNKYCIKCGKAIEVCPACEGRGTFPYVFAPCPTCKGTGTVHKCKPEDLEVKSFEERWIEDEMKTFERAVAEALAAKLLFLYWFVIVLEKLREVRR